MENRPLAQIFAEVLALLGMLAIPTAVGYAVVNETGKWLLAIPIGFFLLLMWAGGIWWLTRDIRRIIGA